MASPDAGSDLQFRRRCRGTTYGSLTAREKVSSSSTSNLFSIIKKGLKPKIQPPTQTSNLASRVPKSTGTASASRIDRIVVRNLQEFEGIPAKSQPNKTQSRIPTMMSARNLGGMSSRDEISSTEQKKKDPSSFRLLSGVRQNRIKLSEDDSIVFRPEQTSMLQSSRDIDPTKQSDHLEMHIPLLSNLGETFRPKPGIPKEMNDHEKRLHLESVQRRRFTLLAGKIENLPGVKSTGMDSTVKQVYNKYGHVTNLKEIRRRFFDQLEEKFYLQEKYELKQNQKQSALITALANNSMRLKAEEKRKGQLDWFSIAGGTNKNLDWAITNPITTLWIRAQKKYSDYKASKANVIKQDVSSLFDVTAAYAIERRL